MINSRFGHFDDPSMDFCEEVDTLEGMAYDESIGMGDRDELIRRITRALEFNVGGCEYAIRAKAALRKIADKYRQSAS